MSDAPVTGALAEIRDEFLDLEEQDRLLLLLDFANELPELPDRYADHPDLLERVVECQSPVFLTVEVADDEVSVIASAPREAPTTRGFASILAQGLEGLSMHDVLAVPDDFPQMLGLGRAVSPLRLSGMSGMLARIKRQVREKSADAR
ncbi:SufE family protein [Paramicrobacterium agarici]|uniref:Cysteine desulfuration protein SufE n=1 Tax=Paramicrobacterium agarici TaxID=630514 RepID=A0A2A9DY80_9MICO|nr:SufE family protein [Microbacterium agarici]PFG31281.1 cysteine desulfuration protein SufE [Microbacterium agarici]TQO24383.1 cysteine desulfuration protein SufE [Microbacterium agarici]